MKESFASTRVLIIISIQPLRYLVSVAATATAYQADLDAKADDEAAVQTQGEQAEQR